MSSICHDDNYNQTIILGQNHQSLTTLDIGKTGGGDGYNTIFFFDKCYMPVRLPSTRAKGVPPATLHEDVIPFVAREAR